MAATDSNPFPLNIATKEDTWEKLQLMANVPEEFQVPAAEFNKIVQAISYLYNRGIDQTSNFKGTFESHAALVAAHPAGVAGDYAFTLTDDQGNDGTYEYRWNPNDLEWQTEPQAPFSYPVPMYVGASTSAKCPLNNPMGITMDADSPSTISTFIPVIPELHGWVRRVVDTTGRTEFQSVTGSVFKDSCSHDFEADTVFDLWIGYDGSRVEHFFTKRQ